MIRRNKNKLRNGESDIVRRLPSADGFLPGIETHPEVNGGKLAPVTGIFHRSSPKNTETVIDPSNLYGDSIFDGASYRIGTIGSELTKIAEILVIPAGELSKMTDQEKIDAAARLLSSLESKSPAGGVNDFEADISGANLRENDADLAQVQDMHVIPGVDLAEIQASMSRHPTSQR